MSPEKKKREPQPPGNWVKRAAQVPALRGLLQHTHIEQVTDDHQWMWHEAKTEEEKYEVHIKYRKQLGWAVFGFTGFELTLYGVGALFSTPTTGLAMLLVGAAILHVTTKGH